MHTVRLKIQPDRTIEVDDREYKDLVRTKSLVEETSNRTQAATGNNK
jgi:hypothetical protein